MAALMTLTSTTASISVNGADFGYTTTISLDKKITQRADGTYTIFDSGAAFDTRACKCTVFLPIVTMKNLLDFFLNIAKGRGQEITMQPQTGFFPFGCDKGDQGTFTVKVAAIEQKMNIGHPEDYAETDITFINTGSWPAYTPIAKVKEGELIIGTVQDLRWPITQPTLSAQYGLDAKISHGNNVFIIDKTVSYDCYETEMELTLNQGNMAALIAYMVNTGRGISFNIIAPVNSYLFGMENSASDTFSVNWIEPSMEIIHETHNRFSTKLKFHIA